MEEKGLPNPRFSEFTQVLNQEGNPIGFSIPNCSFIFKYDSQGGWYDEEGRYYNSEGIQQSDEEDVDDLQEDDDGSQESDDELIDQFQDMLRRQEQGYVKPVQKKAQEEEDKPVSKPSAEKKNNALQDYQELLLKYLKKQRLKENLPGQLFIYFKQKAKYFEEIKPQIQKLQSTNAKNEHIDKIIKQVDQKRKSLITAEKWLAQPDVFLDFSGESQVAGAYERYWYGHIKTTAQKYLQFLNHITESENFYLLQNKTYYALKSKFYHRKREEDIKKKIKQFSSTIEALGENQTIVVKLDNLPQFFPLSTVYDLVQYVNGNPEEIQSAKVIDQYSAQLTVLKSNALKLINLQAYNHDKGEYVQITLQATKDSILKLPITKRFYSISIQGAFKVHERELNDTLGLKCQALQLAKHCTQQNQSEHKVRFILGSVSALKKVLMFRGQSLNPILVHSQVPKEK